MGRARRRDRRPDAVPRRTQGVPHAGQITAAPRPELDALAAFPAPHHPLVLGAAVAAGGGSPAEAASISAYGAVTGPADGALGTLPAVSAPALDIFAELHHQADLRLFES
ncbi:hypothetical protein [Actinomadura madurae]|uniref:hypothetical protein n=1 Tax=Actinomadura madurae TaxID=1993 RepID=UPI000D917EED|nr:hypothetical protein [Actinomadura madurae]SPT60177.1 Uncharacterised protein [Actinomadura madurae]